MELKGGLLEFIRTNVRTIWALEQLLLMAASPERHWTVAELVAELRSSTPLVQKNLAAFERAGLVAPMENNAYRFAPANAALAEYCAALEALYRDKPLLIRSVIVSPDDRLRELANAFKIRKEPE